MTRPSVAELVYDRIVGGARIVFLGGVLAALFTVAGRTVVARLFAPDVYGAFSIGVTFLLLVGVLGYGAVSRGIARQVSFAIEEDGDGDPAVFASWGLLVIVGATVVLTAFILAGAGEVARVVFDEPAYEAPIRTVGLGLPFFGLIYGLASTFRGYGRAGGRVLFYDVARTASFPLIVLAGALLIGTDPIVAYAAFPVSLGVTALGFAAYTARHPDAELERSPRRLLANRHQLGTLVRFSLPLLLSGIFLKLMTRADTFMIGMFLPPAAVGQYAAVRPLLRPISVVWMSMIWMYTPLISSLTARSAMDRIQQIYLAMTKWFCLLTYPLAATVALFPRSILLALFGPEYVPASLALRLVAAGFFLGNVFGPTGATLTGLGHTKVLLAANAAAAAVNLLLNVALIPRFGLAGAALGTITAQSVRNLLRLAVLYRRHSVHALRGEFVAPTLLATLLVLGLRGALAALGPPGVGTVASFAGLTFLVYLAAYPATDSVTPADREMAGLIYRKTRVALGRTPTLGR